MTVEGLEACERERLHLKTQKNATSEWIVSQLAICVSWGPLRRHQVRIRCAENQSGEMSEKDKGKDKEKVLEKATKTHRSQCWSDSCDGERKGKGLDRKSLGL